MKYPLVMLLVFILFGCSKTPNNLTEIEEESLDLSLEWNRSYIDLEIDSFRTFDLKTKDQSFVRFVEGEENLLWVFTPNSPFKKINLRDTSISCRDASAERIIGNGIGRNNVIVDPKDPNILWIARPRQTLIKYDSKTKNFTNTPMKINYKLKITDNWVVSKGKNLLLFNKNTNEVDTIRHFIGQTIYSIVETERFGLVINRQMYNPIFKKFETILKINNVKITKPINYLLEKDSLLIFGLGKYSNNSNTLINGWLTEKNIPTIPKYRIIEDSSFWSYSHYIYKWNLVDGKFKQFDFYLPTQRVKTYVNDDGKYWILSPKEIFSFDRKTESISRHPSPKNKSKVLQSFIDDQYLYVLYDNEFCIYNKDYLERQKNHYPAFEQLELKNEYLAYIAELRLSECTTLSEYKVLEYKIETQFETFLSEHPFREYKSAGSNIFAFPEFSDDIYQSILKNENLDTLFLEINLPYLATYFGTSGRFYKVFQMDSVLSVNHPELRKRLAVNYRYSDGVDKINNYFKNVNILENTISDLDSLAFLKIVEMKGVVHSVWFCGEGCGGCDQRLLINKWNDFLKTNYNPSLQDDAAFELLSIGLFYEENYSETLKTYETFLADYPNSSKKLQVLKELLYFYRSNIYDEHNQVSFNRKKGKIVVQKIKSEFSDSMSVEEYEQYDKIFE